MEPPTEHRTGHTRMRHREDDALVFPRRPNENLALDVDSGRQARVFADNIGPGGELNMYNQKGSSNNARLFIIGGFCCFLFLLATISIYSSLNQQDNVDVRAIDETKIESEPQHDEIIEETSDEELEKLDDCAGEGDEGNTMYGMFKQQPVVVEEVIIITEIDDDGDGDGAGETSEEDSVVEEADDLTEAAMEQDGREMFIMEVNGVQFQIGISKDGEFDLPEGLILNPRVREHWTLIEKTLGLNYEDDESETAGDGPDNTLEAPVSEKEEGVIDSEQPELSGNEQPARMPDGLLFDAPPINGEHEHGEGCEPISVDVGNSFDDLAAGDKVVEDDKGK